MTTNKRLNYNVPLELTPMIRRFAAEDGQEPAYWLRKVLEKAVRDRIEQDSRLAG